MKTSLFIRGPSQTLRFFLLAGLSFFLMVYDQKGVELSSIRGWISMMTYPIQYTVDLPARVSASLNQVWKSEAELRRENERLRQSNQILAARLQTFLALREENDQLRHFLDTPARAETTLIAGRLLAVSMGPGAHKILIDKGTKDGVSVGMSIADEHGLMGQVTRVFPLHAEGMLISDPNHVVPTQSVRNGTRAALAGTGKTDELRLLHIPLTADIAEGDILVTSGLGGRFPTDYPVARVSRVMRQAGDAFSNIVAVPLAELDRSRNIVLLKAVPRLVGEAPPAAEAESQPPQAIPPP